MAHYGKPNKDQCLEACKNEDSCGWFSFNKEKRFCLLFQSCPTIDENETHFLTGQLDCEYKKNCKCLTPLLRIQFRFDTLTKMELSVSLKCTNESINSELKIFLKGL